jgi:hypothetical protein
MSVVLTVLVWIGVFVSIGFAVVALVRAVVALVGELYELYRREPKSMTVFLRIAVLAYAMPGNRHFLAI